VTSTRFVMFARYMFARFVIIRAFSRADTQVVGSPLRNRESKTHGELGFIEITGAYLSFYVSSGDDAFIEYLAKAVNQVGEFPFIIKNSN
jgi:hypothetical protein